MGYSKQLFKILELFLDDVLPLLTFSGTVQHTGHVLLVNPRAISGVLSLKTQIQTLSGYRAQSRRSTGGSGAVQVGASDNTVCLPHDIGVYQLFRLTFNTHQYTTCTCCSSLCCYTEKYTAWIYIEHCCSCMCMAKIKTSYGTLFNQNTHVKFWTPPKKSTTKGFPSQSLGPAKQDSYVMRMSWFRTAFL